MNLVWLLILGGLWGSSYLFIKVAVGEVPPLTLVAGRLVLAAAILWTVLAVVRQAMPRSRRLWAAFAVMGLLNGAVPYSLIFWSEQHISSGLASLLQATMPLFTVLMGHFLLRDERMTAGRAAGVILGLCGGRPADAARPAGRGARQPAGPTGDGGLVGQLCRGGAVRPQPAAGPAGAGVHDRAADDGRGVDRAAQPVGGRAATGSAVAAGAGELAGADGSGDGDRLRHLFQADRADQRRLCQHRDLYHTGLWADPGGAGAERTC